MREIKVFAVSSEGLTDSEKESGAERVAAWILKDEMFFSREEAEQGLKAGTVIAEYRVTIHAELVEAE